MKNTRQIDGRLVSHFKKYDFALVLLGARQVGKTTLLKRLFPNAKYLLLDEDPVKKSLETYSLASYKQILGDSKQIILDELHLLSDPGRAVKIIYDQMPSVQIVVTGSSALHIKNKTGESMAGRAITYKLYPLTFSEFLFQNNVVDKIDSILLEKILENNEGVNVKTFDQSSLLESLLLYGSYPTMINIPEDRKYLSDLAETAIFKDIIELNLIDNRKKAKELLKLLAYQIGNLISYSEISRKIGLNINTVQKYIEIFEESFLLYRVYPFSKNKRSEIAKAPKIYFWDLGIRNALIKNFDSLNVRSDYGAMFENFIINEVKKLIDYENLDYEVNYWRLKSGSEVDLVLSTHKEIIGCEIKTKKSSLTPAFVRRYPEAKTHVVTTENFY